MKNLDYYKQQPKADVHNHLNLSMSYERFQEWAGVTIPDFPRRMTGLGEMHQVIARYTRPQAKTARNVMDLFEMSLEAAIADNVVYLEASVDIGFIKQFGYNLDTFLQSIDGLVKKYSKDITFIPELGLPKTADKALLDKWAAPMIESGVFKNIDLYGPEVFDDIDFFTKIFKLAGQEGVKKKAHVGEFSDAVSVRQFVEGFELDEVQHGIGAAGDPKTLEFLARNKIRCNVCPESNYMLSAVNSLKEHPIKTMMDAGVPVGLGTDDLLFFGKTNSEQLYDLVVNEVITEADAETLLAVR